MTDHLFWATNATQERVRELGADRLIGALTDAVEGEEEWVVSWFDAEEDDWSADEISGWSIVKVVAFARVVAYVELSLELAAYSVEDEETPMQVIAIPGFARVLLGPPLVVDRLELDRTGLRSCIEADAEDLSRLGVSDVEAVGAEVAAYLASSEGSGVPRSGTVMMRETEQGVEIFGLPGPDAITAGDDDSDSGSPAPPDGG